MLLIASCIQGLLFLAPLLVLGLLLRLRYHPGERLIVALHKRARAGGLRLARTSIHVRAYPVVESARGGRLIASALAGRAPPIVSTVA